MSDRSESAAILAGYRRLIDFLVGVYGQQNEMVLFEINPDTLEGIVLAQNNSTYHEGDPMSPIARRILEDSADASGYDFLVNINTDPASSMRRKQSYYFIRNADNRLVGMLSIAFEIDAMLWLKTTVDQILGFEAVGNRPQEQNDLYYELDGGDFSISKYARGIIQNVITEFGVTPERMTIDEKAAIVHRLDDMEVFTIKGSVQEAAQQLLVSQATLYRLMKRS